MAGQDITRKAWIGNIHGTLVGNVFVEFTPGRGDTFDVVLRVNVGNGAVVLTGPLITLGERTSADLSQRQTAGGPTAIGAHIDFSLISQERIEGRWEMLDGNAGTLLLSPERLQEPAPTSATTDTRPIQVIQSNRRMPKITIYRDELKVFCSAMKTWLNTPFDVVIRAEVNGQEVRTEAQTFWDLPTLPSKTSYISLWLSEPGVLPRSININLLPSDCSFTVTGTDPVWVAGTLEQAQQMLGRKHGWWKGFYEQHALNLNGIAMLLAIALSPGLNFPGRVTLLGATALLAVVVKHLHDKTTALNIHLREDFRKASLLDYPRLLTALAGTALIGFVTWAHTQLSGGLFANVWEWAKGQP